MSISGSILHGITPKISFPHSHNVTASIATSRAIFGLVQITIYNSISKSLWILLFSHFCEHVGDIFFSFFLTFPVFFQIERFPVSNDTSYTLGVIEKIDVEVDAISWDRASCQSWSLCLHRSLYMLHNRYNLIYPDLSRRYLDIRYVPRTKESIQLRRSCQTTSRLNVFLPSLRHQKSA